MRYPQHHATLCAARTSLKLCLPPRTRRAKVHITHPISFVTPDFSFRPHCVGDLSLPKRVRSFDRPTLYVLHDHEVFTSNSVRVPAACCGDVCQPKRIERTSSDSMLRDRVIASLTLALGNRTRKERVSPSISPAREISSEAADSRAGRRAITRHGASFPDLDVRRIPGVRGNFASLTRTGVTS